MIVKVGEKDLSSPFFRFLLRFCRCRRCFVIRFRGPYRRLHSQQPECSGAFVEIYQVFGVSTCVTACRRIRDVAADGLRSLVIDYRNFGRSGDRVRGRHRTSCRPGGRDYNIHGIRALLRCDRMANLPEKNSFLGQRPPCTGVETIIYSLSLCRCLACRGERIYTSDVNARYECSLR